jgi:hypothetical protein
MLLYVPDFWGRKIIYNMFETENLWIRLLFSPHIYAGELGFHLQLFCVRKMYDNIKIKDVAVLVHHATNTHGGVEVNLHISVTWH